MLRIPRLFSLLSISWPGPTRDRQPLYPPARIYALRHCPRATYPENSPFRHEQGSSLCTECRQESDSVASHKRRTSPAKDVRANLHGMGYMMRVVGYNNSWDSGHRQNYRRSRFVGPRIRYGVPGISYLDSDLSTGL